MLRGASFVAVVQPALYSAKLHPSESARLLARQRAFYGPVGTFCGLAQLYLQSSRNELSSAFVVSSNQPPERTGRPTHMARLSGAFGRPVGGIGAAA